MDVLRRLHQMVRNRADQQIDPAFIAGVFDPADYADPGQITPSRFGRDFARLRFLVEKYGPGVTDHPDLRHGLKTAVLGPFLRLAAANGEKEPIVATGRAIWDAVDQRLEQFRPDWSQNWNDTLERQEERFNQTRGHLHALLLRSYGEAIADHLTETGALKPAAPGTTPPATCGSAADRIRQATTPEQFLEAWNGAVTPHDVRYGGDRVPRMLVEAAQARADHGTQPAPARRPTSPGPRP